MVHEVEDCQDTLILDSLEVEQRVLVGVSLEDTPEEGTAGTQDHFVGLQLVVFTGKSHIKEVFILPQLTEGTADVAFKVIPPKAKLLSWIVGHCGFIKLTSELLPILTEVSV